MYLYLWRTETPTHHGKKLKQMKDTLLVGKSKCQKNPFSEETRTNLQLVASPGFAARRGKLS